TDNSLDMMIQGEGFFEILMPDGSSAYSRNGQFTMDDEGNLVTPGAGYLLQPQITIPDDAINIVISQDGEVSVTQQGQAEPSIVGQINTINFVNPTGLEPIGQNLFTETQVSGTPQEGVPGLEGYGMIVQGALETSNVNTTEELVNLIQSQRVYEMNSKVISAVDEMLSYINQQL
ncbi:MAG: flagellar basal body rod protein FlgG, partial [Colwellia sp.]|nr:flagellar basal body rod protein FlgG [Colwellia sp.]